MKFFPRHLLFVPALLFLLTSTTLAAPPQPQGDAKRWDGYFQGLMRIREGKWADAVTTLTEAEKLARGDHQILLARGVARTLLGDYENARTDLDRAQIKGSREPQLWQYAVSAMTDDLRIGGNIGNNQRKGPDGRPVWFMGVPGHIVAGGNDYTTPYASFVIYDMAMSYRNIIEAEKRVDEEAFNKTKTAAGRWFANRVLAAPQMSSRMYDHAKVLIKSNDLRNAREVLDIARASYRFDHDMATTSGEIWLLAGRPATARKDFTIALTNHTAWGPAYAGRAIAAATMGDAGRARADLANAKLHNSASKTLETQIDDLLEKNSVKGEPAELLAALDKAAIDGGSVESLVPIAEKLHRVMTARRVRYDEIFQDRLRELEAKMRANQKDIEVKLDAAQYLVDEVSNRGENIEPRRGAVGFRWQPSQADELNRALWYCNQALLVDAKHTRALITKAFVLAEQNQESAANALLNEAMAGAGKSDPRAVRLFATFRRRQISRMLAAAAGLRTPTTSISTHTENRSDGVYEVTTTRTYQPSQSDLARAAALERQARMLMDQAKQVIEAAIRESKNTLDGFILESTYENWFGTSQRALALLDQAVKKYPKEIAAHDAYVQQLRHMGQRDAAQEAEAVALQLVHTTSAPLLRKVWDMTAAQGWTQTQDVLNRARKLDPTDARGTIYLAAMEANLEDKPKAAAYYAAAAALEMARIQLDEVGIAKSWPRRADDMAALMGTRNILARAAKLFGKPDQELLHYQAAAALAQRYPPDGFSTPMFHAMIPTQSTMKGVLPAPENGASIAAEAYVGAGRNLKAANRVNDAIRYYQAAAALVAPGNSGAPNIGNAKGDTNFSGNAGTPAAEALVELAKIDMEKRDYNGAMAKLSAAGQSKPTDSVRQEINQLMNQILKHMRER